MRKTLFSTLDSRPALLTSQDLVDIGLYATKDTAYVARIKGQSPPFVKLERKILYPKEGVIEFLEQRLHKEGKLNDVATAPQPHNNAE